VEVLDAAVEEEAFGINLCVRGERVLCFGVYENPSLHLSQGERDDLAFSIIIFPLSFSASVDLREFI